MGESRRLERARFFRGKQLTPEDLELQQQYFREKLNGITGCCMALESSPA